MSVKPVAIQSGAVSAAFYVYCARIKSWLPVFFTQEREQPFTGGFRHLGQRLCEGGELIAQPAGLLDIIEADNADILRNIQTKLVASGVNKAAGNKVGDAEYAVGRFSGLTVHARRGLPSGSWYCRAD